MSYIFISMYSEFTIAYMINVISSLRYKKHNTKQLPILTLKVCYTLEVYHIIQGLFNPLICNQDLAKCLNDDDMHEWSGHLHVCVLRISTINAGVG